MGERKDLTRRTLGRLTKGGKAKGNRDYGALMGSSSEGIECTCAIEIFILNCCNANAKSDNSRLILRSVFLHCYCKILQLDTFETSPWILQTALSIKHTKVASPLDFLSPF